MDNPFIKVEWEDTPENLTQERIKRVKSYFEKKYNSTSVKIITKTTSNDTTTKLKSLDVSDNILDNQYQKKLIKDFIEDNKIEVKWDMINRLDDRVNGEIDKLSQNKIRYNKWHIKKVEFSNFLSFGQDNTIDFTELNGITVIQSNPSNFGGKTTLTVDLLSFLFFNTTTKTKTNGDIFNKFTDVDEVNVKGHVTIDNEDYIINRIITRKKSKSGEYTVKNELNFSKVSQDGEVVNLSGEQRRETEEIIVSAIGTEEDFLSTILTTGNNLEELIESKPTARGQILTKFLGLESLKQKEEICKTIYNEWSKKLVSNTNNIVDLQDSNTKHNEGITTSKSDIIFLEGQLDKTNNKVKDLEDKRESALKKRNNDVDQDLIRINPDVLNKEILVLKNKKTEIDGLALDINVIEPSEYYSEDKHDEIKKLISELNVDLRVTKGDVEKFKKLIKGFEEGSICPTCKRSLDDVDHTNEIDKLKFDIKDCEGHVSELETTLKFRDEDDLKLNNLKKEYDEYERNKLRKVKHELESEQKQLEINSKELRLQTYESNKNKLEENKLIDADIVFLRTQIDSANGEVRQITTNIETNRGNIVTLEEKIKINLELIKKIKSEEELLSVFKVYLSIYGKNGISKVIIKNMIPLLNQELHRILLDSCHFTLELNINDKNELEFLMIDNETRVIKTLSSGSGYEKTISSLAIRSVLTKVSSLPKPNIVVMDEVFGKIADENLEMVGEFFKKIKNYFEHIFVITHTTLVRNWADNIIMVKKSDDNVSSIDYVNTKI
jgi:DNA repair exonuclease SbcCD ATPase subunit